MTFKIFFSVLIILGSTFAIPSHAKEKKKERSSVTYEGGGRFGDQLMCYLHAKWISYQYNIPLLYKPFAYSDQLAMHKLEKRFSKAKESSFAKIIRPSLGDNVDYGKAKNTLFIIPYFPESLWERQLPSSAYYYFPIDWKNTVFRSKVIEMIAWKDFKPKINIPADRISVAVHVRKGGGYDPSNIAQFAPLKFPPDSFFIDQIKNIHEILNRVPLYVYIFTDEPNPLEIVQKYQPQIEGRNITFDYRKEGNHHAVNVLQDFFEMMRFDCLIRPESNFSMIPSLIKDYRILIKPVRAMVNSDSTIIIEDVEIIFG